MRVLNLERGRPAAQAAMQLLSQELRLARVQRVRAVKVIHGYGSSGKGTGAIKAAAHRLLRERMARGQIRAFVPGEEFGPLSNRGREAAAILPELRRDADFGRANDGVTIVLL